MNATPTMQQFPLGALPNPLIDDRFSTEGLRTLEIDLKIVGKLYIAFDALDEASVTAAGDEHFMPRRIERRGKSLYIGGNSLGSYLSKGQKEKLFIEVHVPRETKLRLNMFAGVVILDGGTGDVDIKGWFGEVTGVSEAEKVKVRLYAGDVTLNDLPGKATVQLLVGSMNLGWSSLSGDEDVQAHCGLGGVDLTLPVGVTKKDDIGGFCAKKRIKTSDGTRIKSWVGFGGLDVLEWGSKQKWGDKQKRKVQII
jgi:hypothetical protein